MGACTTWQQLHGRGSTVAHNGNIKGEMLYAESILQYYMQNGRGYEILAFPKRRNIKKHFRTGPYGTSV